MRKLLLILENKNGKLIKGSKQALSFASYYTNRFGDEIEVVLYGKEIEDSVIDEIKPYGVEKIYIMEGSYLGEYNPEHIKGHLVNIIKKSNPNIVLGSNTNVGKDLFPKLAQSFDAEMGSDSINVEYRRDEFIFWKSVYGGKIVEKMKVPENGIYFGTIRVNTFSEFPKLADKEPVIEKSIIEEPGNLRYKVLGVENKVEKGKSLGEAEVLICGGRGFKNKFYFEKIYELADLLDGEVGSARAAIDAGWIEEETMVGQTGIRTKPRLYMGFGLSGAMQHLAGMDTARYIVAVNKDPDAMIFDVVDFGIIGDTTKIVPKIIRELKKMKKLESDG